MSNHYTRCSTAENRQADLQPSPASTPQTQPKFTPGPWERIPQSSGGDLIAQRFETGNQMNPTGLRLIAFMQSRGSSLAMDNANANLISAAPEMYEVLVGVIEEMELADFDPEDTDSWYGRALEVRRKAEGGAA